MYYPVELEQCVVDPQPTEICRWLVDDWVRGPRRCRRPTNWPGDKFCWQHKDINNQYQE